MIAIEKGMDMTLTPAGYRPRLVDPLIDDMLKRFGCVSIEGTKYCGKTWTARTHCNSMYALDDSSQNYRNHTLASIDMNYALEGEPPHLIDEWQMIPAIWDGVRGDVDMSGSKGKYVLCKSSVPIRPGVDDIQTHSGMGRIVPIRMRTMSLFESGDSDGNVSMSGLFDGEFKNTPIKDVNLEDLIRLTMRGGWPGIIDNEPDDLRGGMPGYVDALCERDLPRIDPGKDQERMKRLIRSLARNESTLASIKTISNDMKENEDDTIKDTTVSNYIDALDRMFLIENQPAYSPNIRSSKRIGKKPKRHLSDPAIGISALGLTKDMLFKDLNTYGFFFEGMCERDLQIYAQSVGGKLFHYREGNNEVDAIVEMPDRRWGMFEIKLGTNQVDEAADNMTRIADSLENSVESGSGWMAPSFMCVLCGVCSAAYRRDDGVYVVPITSLRN